VTWREPPDYPLLIQPGDLLPGDVLLYRPRTPNLVQKAISLATDSPYTHAAIFLGDGLMAESMFPGA
jgi:cell wall-associated NlpC family hydrolase